MRGKHRPSRRVVVTGMAAWLAAPRLSGAQADTLRFGLTPVFLSSDLDLLERLKRYFEAETGRPVELVTRRTYQEITTLLVSARVGCGVDLRLSFVAFRDRLALVAVPVWRGRPLYQSYLIAASGRNAHAIGDLAGDVHAFSDGSTVNLGFTGLPLPCRTISPNPGRSSVACDLA